VPVLKSLLAFGKRMYAAATGGGALPPAPLPKVKNKQVSFPSYLTNTSTNDNALPRLDRRLANTDIGDYRTGISTPKVVRDLAAANPDLSAAINAYVRTALTDTYTAVARNVDGTFNPEATQLLQQILTRIDVVGNYDDGFSGIWSLRALSEALLKELMIEGAIACELVLDKARLPRTLAPVATSQIVFKADNKWLKPIQKLGGEEIDLDQPTFFYASIDQDLLQPYAASPMEPAIQPVLFSTALLNDIRRIVRRAVHPRIKVTIDEEKFRKYAPPEVINEPAKLQEYMNTVLASLESTINDLEPEHAVVLWDSITMEILSRGNESYGQEVQVLQELANSKLTTGAKTLPSILGHGTGSQNIASSETLLFMKNAAGAQAKLNEIYSKAFTLAVRLFGQDVYVDFKYAPIDLRPESELEAFRAMKQSRLLELLSFGFLTDEDAAIQLTGQLPPTGFKPLSGTQFMQPAPVGAGAGGNPNSNTSGPQDRRTSTPQQSKGPQKKADVIPLQ
jgi:hypothetical protein